jgi:hypothetical protein
VRELVEPKKRWHYGFRADDREYDLLVDEHKEVVDELRAGRTSRDALRIAIPTPDHWAVLDYVATLPKELDNAEDRHCVMTALTVRAHFDWALEIAQHVLQTLESFGAIERYLIDNATYLVRRCYELDEGRATIESEPFRQHVEAQLFYSCAFRRRCVIGVEKSMKVIELQRLLGPDAYREWLYCVIHRDHNCMVHHEPRRYRREPLTTRGARAALSVLEQAGLVVPYKYNREYRDVHGAVVGDRVLVPATLLGMRSEPK